ncbi:MAG: DUF1156 domain-containing protein, partial [Planctomycetes bacterium]|nr:DUF1156 domain-containing protein [Planctomycetota bacterium]
DFFYVWLRRSLQGLFPDVCTTLAAPKEAELVAKAHKHDGKERAYELFLQGMSSAISRFASDCDHQFPVTIYYAFKQAENDGDAVSSTGWESFLEALIQAGFAITGTWPMRTEKRGRVRENKANALASSIVLVCRRREDVAPRVTRRDFANALRRELPVAIKHLQSGNVAPVDLAQASIGPGMAVFSRYSKVVNADGSRMSVREALQLINQALDEALVEQESEFDAETRFALRWFEQYGMQEGPFGDAETLAKAMAVAVSSVVEARIVKSRASKVCLLSQDQLDPHWNPANGNRLTMWESTQQLIRKLEKDGETGAAVLLAALIEHKGSAYAESVRELGYRLYQTCDRAKRSEEARRYNGLVVSWPEIARLAQKGSFEN